MCNPYITAVTASGNVITVRDNGGHSGTITLSGATTSDGGLTASCFMCNPYITAVTAQSNAIIVEDNGGNSGYITLN